MTHHVPVSIRKMNQGALLQFSLREIQDVREVAAVYLMMKLRRNVNPEEIRCRLYEQQRLYYDPMWDGGSERLYRSSRPYSVRVDVTDLIHALVSGTRPNNGILVDLPNNDIYDCQLQFSYGPRVIAPRNGCNPFFESTLRLSSDTTQLISPWYLTGYSTLVTFCIQNLGDSTIQVFLQYSPDTRTTVDDIQLINIAPGESELLVPILYTKYMRIVATSTTPPISIKLWQQTQLVR